MARRNWNTQREWKSRKGYQKKRSRSHRKEFVKGGADPKITRFDIGNRKKPPEEWDVSLGLMIKKRRIKVSHFALEALRIKINRGMEKKAGRKNFYLKIRAHPHYMWREHSQLGFAGADRISSGMRNAFGKPVGRCARMKPPDLVCELHVNEQHVPVALERLKIAGQKICTTTQLVLLRSKTPEIGRRVPVPKYSNFT